MNWMMRAWLSAAVLAFGIAAFGQEPDTVAPESGAGNEETPPVFEETQAPGGFEETRAPEIEIIVPAAEEEEVGPGSASDPLLDRINQELAGGGGEAGGTSAATPGGPAPAPSATDLLRWVTVLLFVVALIIVAGYVARKIGGKTPLLAGAHLARVLGRVHLARGATLYYLHTGGRVLVLGVTGNAISLVAEFDAAAFDVEDEPAQAGGPMDAESFLQELQKSSRAMGAKRGEIVHEDDEITSLRDDIHRLQAYLQEESRERKG